MLRGSGRPAGEEFEAVSGFGAAPVLIWLAVRFAGRAPTLGSALAVSAFHSGTAVVPAAVGAVVAAPTPAPAIAVAVVQRRRAA